MGVELGRDTVGQRLRGNTARLRVRDDSVDTATDLETDLRQLRALAAPGRTAHDDDRMRNNRGRDLRALGMDRQALVVVHRRHGPASLLDPRYGRPLAVAQPSALFASAHSASSSSSPTSDGCRPRACSAPSTCRKRRSNLAFASRSASSASRSSRRATCARLEEQVAQLFTQVRRIVCLRRALDLGDLLAHLREHASEVRPVETDTRSTLAELLGPRQRRQRPRDAVECARAATAAARSLAL